MATGFLEETEKRREKERKFFFSAKFVFKE
jgi:hypothetical protein